MVMRPRASMFNEKWVTQRNLVRRICAAYPGSYEEASSSLGYHFTLTCGSSFSLRAERTFAPSAEPVLENYGLLSPLRTIDTARGVGGCGAIFFSVAYELQVFHMIDILRASGLGVFKEERGYHDPLIVAGGACVLSNPALLFPFADILVMGDGEEVLSILSNEIIMGKQKDALLDHVRSKNGVIIEEKDLENPELARAPENYPPVSSAYITDNTVFKDTFLIEVMKGCLYDCAFCVMSRKRNGREVKFFSSDKIISAIPESIKKVGLVGASVLDHPQIDEVLTFCEQKGIELTLSSMNARKFTQQVAKKLAKCGLKLATIAMDAPSERIGRKIHKPSKRKDLVNAAISAREAGFKKLRLYVLVGFEDEEKNDYSELVDICRELASIIPLTVSLGPVVPKKMTEIASMPFVSKDRYKNCIKFLQSQLGGNLELKPASWRIAAQEYRLGMFEPWQARLLVNKEV